MFQILHIQENNNNNKNETSVKKVNILSETVHKLCFIHTHRHCEKVKAIK